MRLSLLVAACVLRLQLKRAWRATQTSGTSRLKTHSSGYTLTSIAPVAGLSQHDTAAAVRRDAERLGLSKLVELVDSFRGNRKPTSPRLRSASEGPAPAQTPEELAKGVYLRGVQREVTKPQLNEALSAFGTVVSVRVVYTKRCAFAEFETEDSAKAAIAASTGSNGLEISGIRVKVDVRCFDDEAGILRSAWTLSPSAAQMSRSPTDPAQARQPGLRKSGRNGARSQPNGDDGAGPAVHEDDEDEVDHDGQA